MSASTRALARLLGLSRSAVAELADAGGVRRRRPRAWPRATGCAAGSWLEVELPRRRRRPAPDPEPVSRACVVVHDDDDLVVVDKPVGVAAHPSPGWTGPTVVGGLAAAGYRIATSGAAERQGVVHRLDVGTSGLMVVAKSEYAYSRLKQAFRDRTVDKTYHALVQGHPDPLVRHDRRADRPASRAPTGSWPSSRAASRASPTTRCWRRSGRRAWSRSTSRPAGRTRSGCTSRRCATRASAT